MGIIQDVQDRIGRYQHYKNRIEREKLMIDPLAIMLVEEFQAKAVEPVLASKPRYFSHLFNQGAPYASILQCWGMNSQIKRFSIPKHELPEEQRAYLPEATIDIEAEVEERVGIYAENNIDGEAARARSMREVMREVAEHRLAHGYYLINIVQAIALSEYPADALKKHEQRALWHDEGRAVLTFWEGVNHVKDLSGFFPDKPKPDGNDKDKRKQGARAPVWRPAWGLGS